MIALIWKNLLHRKLQNLALILSIAISVAILFSICSIYSGVDAGLELSKQRMGADIVIIPFGVRMDPSLYLFGGATTNVYLPAKFMESVRAVPGIKRVTPQFFAHTLADSTCCDLTKQTRVIGYDPATDWIIGPWLKDLSKQELADNEVILGAKVAASSKDKISIVGKEYNIVTLADDTGSSLDYSIFVSMAEARRIAGDIPKLKAAFAKQGPATEWISSILVQIDPAYDIHAIVEGIQQAGYMQPIVAAEVKQRISEQFTVLVVLLGAVGILTGLAALFQLFSRFYTTTCDRQAEWGLYLALGASGRDIAALIIGEAVMVSLAGSLSGLLLGGALYAWGLGILELYQSFPFVQNSWTELLVLGFSVTGLFSGLGVLAAWLPAYTGSTVDPSLIMVRGEYD
jgi:putative ABC transport system permease protein